MYILKVAVLTALTLAFGVLHSKAQSVEQGVGIICDTPEQVARFVQVYDKDGQQAADQVNREFNSPTACILGYVAFIRGDPTGSVEKGWQVHAILVVAVHLPHGWQAIAPSKFFTAFKVEERGA
jgi:hypothetical protein